MVVKLFHFKLMFLSFSRYIPIIFCLAVKRLMREAAEMSNPTSDYFAAPLEDNLFEWHFTVRGPEDTDFQVLLIVE